MPVIPPVTTRGLNDENRRRRHREVTDLMLNFQHDDSRIRTPAEVAAGVTPVNYAYAPGHLYRYGNFADGADWTSAFQAALLSLEDVQVPDGNYGISTTLQTQADNQLLMGLGDNVYLHKYADVALLKVLHRSSGARRINFYGAYDAFGALIRPAGAPAVTDTTDVVTIGVLGAGTPFFWILDQCNVQFGGRDCVHAADGPAGMIGMLSCAYAARWNFFSEQIVTLAGSAFDTSHYTAQYLQAFNGGRSNSYTEGGNICLQGSAHHLNIKTFGAWGDGLRLNAFGCALAVFTELDGAINSAITTWAAGQSIGAAGTFRRYGKNVYYSTNTGTTGATPPTHTTGTASDGTVTWQFRSGVGVYSTDNGKNINQIQLIYSNGYHNIPETDQLYGWMLDGQSIIPVANRYASKKFKISREFDFGDYTNTGDYSAVEMVASNGAPREFDFAHNAAGAGSPVDVYWGRNGSTTLTEALRLRGSDYGYLADIPVGGRVKSLTGTSYTLFGKSIGEGDIYAVNASGAFTFDLNTGGLNLHVGRRIIIIRTNSAAGTITVQDGTNTFASTLGSLNVGTTVVTLSNQYDWVELYYLGSNLWWTRMKKAGALS